MYPLIIAIMLTMLASPEVGDVSADAERATVIATIEAYHAGLSKGDAAEVLDQLGASFFMADQKSDAKADRMSAHLFLTGEALADWPQAFLDEAGPYRNDFEVTSTSIRGNAAVIDTEDTGRNKFRSWKNEQVTWFLGRTDDGWRIVGMVIRDIQLPKR